MAPFKPYHSAFVGPVCCFECSRRMAMEIFAVLAMVLRYHVKARTPISRNKNLNTPNTIRGASNGMKHVRKNTVPIVFLTCCLLISSLIPFFVRTVFVLLLAPRIVLFSEFVLYYKVKGPYSQAFQNWVKSWSNFGPGVPKRLAQNLGQILVQVGPKWLAQNLGQNLV